MLFLWPGTSTLLRGQGTYLTDDEINAVTAAVCTGEQNFVQELVHLKISDHPGNGEESGGSDFQSRDELYEDAVELVIREGRGSVSLLQRALGIGYGRAGRLIDFMEQDGVVGVYAGQKSREVIMTMTDWELKKSGNANGSPATRPAAPLESRDALDDDHARDDWDAEDQWDEEEAFEDENDDDRSIPSTRPRLSVAPDPDDDDDP
jgi:S-DNA-T family DNA segregation ATPase FtsK/SpoIIIE